MLREVEPTTSLWRCIGYSPHCPWDCGASLCNSLPSVAAMRSPGPHENMRSSATKGNQTNMYVLQDLRSEPRGVAKLLTVRGIAVVLFRASQLFGRIHPALGLTVKQLNHLLTGADIAWQAKVGAGLILYHPTGVVLGPTVSVGNNCVIQQGVTLGGSGNADGAKESGPTLGNEVFVGAGARVIGSVHLGDRVKVGANAVVLDSVPRGATVAGVPARVVRDGPGA